MQDRHIFRLIGFFLSLVVFPAFAEDKPAAPPVDPCGNHHCEPAIGETEASCPADCSRESQFKEVIQKMICGDGACDDTEKASGECPADCGPKP